MKVLLTGCAGFIGMHAGQRLLARGDEVVGVDNFNTYYDVTLTRPVGLTHRIETRKRHFGNQTKKFSH
jgi:nucleoside-diphosphate-sugar epimerase